MHIADGVLTAPVLIAGITLTIAGVHYGLQRIDYEKIPQVAVLSAAFFVASLIHLPLGFSSIHLVLNGLVGLILGWAAFPALTIALFLQAILFGFGGISSLGINVFNMALPAILCFYLARFAIRHTTSEYLLFFCGFCVGAIAIIGSTCLISLSLFLSGEKFLNLIYLLLLTHIPVMVIEGIITGFIVVFLHQVRPEVFAIPVLSCD